MGIWKKFRGDYENIGDDASQAGKVSDTAKTSGKKVKSESKKDSNKVEAKKKNNSSQSTKTKKSKDDTNEFYSSQLLRPIVTEKSNTLRQNHQFVFEIDPRTTKVDVKNAFRAQFGVVPHRVTVMNFSGKATRLGRIYGRRKAWKKAIVSVKKEDVSKVKNI